MKSATLILAAAALVLPIQTGILHLSTATSLAGDHKKKDKEKEGEEKKEETLLAGDHKKKDKEKDGEEEKKEGALLA